jgi:alkanesulfonate monooxygenase SsuD/methylene tetrahydromethanopterin reductase-like flavin-dependent oxidoreductase (luciferase family)
LGYHEAWIGEHITETWENAPVPELLIAKFLALTKPIIFATGVTMLPIRPSGWPRRRRLRTAFAWLESAAGSR